MSLFSAISHIARDFNQARVRFVTERRLSALPTEIRKDIGWPADALGRANGAAAPSLR